jgi:hypothetical protein
MAYRPWKHQALETRRDLPLKGDGVYITGGPGNQKEIMVDMSAHKSAISQTVGP